MKSVFFIVYFGKFNNYFQLFLNSCGYQKNFDFIFITDDRREFKYPDNCKVIYSTMEDFKESAKEKISQKIDIRFAQKLCDYKPTYGFLYANETKKYDYWGFIDVDTILGNFDKLIQPILESNKYDKIFNLGHLTLFKNTPENNALFFDVIDDDGNSFVFSNYRNVKFDEEFNNSISNIFIKNNKIIYEKQLEADIYTKANHFYIDEYDAVKDRHSFYRKRNLFIYNEGNVYNVYKHGDYLIKDEYLYIHLQKREMTVRIDIEESTYKIIPNSFESLEFPFESLAVDNINKIKYFNINNQYLKLRSRNLKIKIKNFLRG